MPADDDSEECIGWGGNLGRVMLSARGVAVAAELLIITGTLGGKRKKKTRPLLFIYWRVFFRVDGAVTSEKIGDVRAHGRRASQPLASISFDADGVSVPTRPASPAWWTSWLDGSASFFLL